MNRDPTDLPDEADEVVDLTSASTVLHPAGPTAAAPAAEPARPPDPVPGDRLGQYRLVRELGAGGMGLVFEAEDEWLSRRVAVKVLRSDLPAGQAARERFLREARAMAAVEHENVCTIYQVNEADGRPYMAMQLLAGETLETRLDREHRLPVAEAARVGRQIALGLAAAHAKGLVHRDVKPANVWLEAGTGRVKLLDFGLALARDNPHLTHTGFVIGTPAFMSPEQARGEPLDGRSDLFSLGVILYLMTTGDRPFDGATAMTVMRNLELHHPARVNVKRVDVPAPFSNLVMELLAKDRKDRPASAAGVADRLARPELVRPTHLPVAPPQVAAAVRPPAPAVGAWRTPYREPGRATSAVRILLMVAAVAVGLALYWRYDVTNYGGLEIVPDVPEAEVQVRRDGRAPAHLGDRPPIHRPARQLRAGPGPAEERVQAVADHGRGDPRAGGAGAGGPRPGRPMKVVIHPPVDPARLARLRAAAPAATFVNAADEPAALREAADADAFLGKITPAMLAAAGRLRWVQSFTASLEHYLFPALAAHPCVLTNMRGLFSDVIADQVMGYVLCFARNLHTYVRNQLERKWAPVGGEAGRVSFAAGPGAVNAIDRAHQHLADQTLGVVGLGAIGRGGRAAGGGVRDARRRRRSAADRPPAGGRVARGRRTDLPAAAGGERLRRDRRPAHAGDGAAVRPRPVPADEAVGAT